MSVDLFHQPLANSCRIRHVPGHLSKVALQTPTSGGRQSSSSLLVLLRKMFFGIEDTEEVEVSVIVPDNTAKADVKAPDCVNWQDCLLCGETLVRL